MFNSQEIIFANQNKQLKDETPHCIMGNKKCHTTYDLKNFERICQCYQESKTNFFTKLFKLCDRYVTDEQLKNNCLKVYADSQYIKDWIDKKNSHKKSDQINPFAQAFTKL